MEFLNRTHSQNGKNYFFSKLEMNIGLTVKILAIHNRYSVIISPDTSKLDMYQFLQRYKLSPSPTPLSGTE